jgi:hypothetical protein
MNACGMAPQMQRWPSKLGAIFSKPWGHVKHQILGIKKLDCVKPPFQFKLEKVGLTFSTNGSTLFLGFQEENQP